MNYLQNIPVEIFEELLFKVDPLYLKDLMTNKYVQTIIQNKNFIERYIQNNSQLNYYIDKNGNIANNEQKYQLLTGLSIPVSMSGHIYLYNYLDEDNIIININDSLKDINEKCN